jgi:hypothetical protein
MERLKLSHSFNTDLEIFKSDLRHGIMLSSGDIYSTHLLG